VLGHLGSQSPRTRYAIDNRVIPTVILISGCTVVSD
jgi:hypothetical protein